MSTKPVRKRSAPRQQMLFTDESLTMQEFADDADINNIMAKYSYSDIESYAASNPVNYLDLSDPIDFQLNQDTLNAARDAFNDLPSKIRREFDNDPHKFLEFVHNPDNRDEMLRLGLMSQPDQSDQIKSPPKEDSKNAEGAAPSST